MSRRRGRLRLARRGSAETRPRVRVSHPSDLLAVIPYLLGFHPQESMVALLARDGQVIVAARMDLPPFEAADGMARYWDGIARQHRADRLALVVYSRDRDPSIELLRAVVERLPREVSDALYADGERWWSATCTRDCCPAEGTPYQLDSHPIAAEAVLAGMGVQPDRDALAALVQGPDAADLPELSEVVDHVLVGAADLLLDRRRSATAI